jgi:hypothetical protein
MPTKSKMTIDHDQIRRWAEAREGRPATVKSTAKNGAAGLLRINFPGYGGEDSLKDISWDDFFERFDDSNLAFVYQDKTASGKQSRFGKFVDRSNMTGTASKKRTTARKQTSSSRSRKAA